MLTATQARRLEIDFPGYVAEHEASAQQCLAAAQIAARLRAETLQALDTDEAILTGDLPHGESRRFLADIDIPGCRASIDRLRSVLRRCVQADVVEVDELLLNSGWAQYIAAVAEPEPAE